MLVRPEAVFDGMAPDLDIGPRVIATDQRKSDTPMSGDAARQHLADLLQQSAAGDRDAFARLYDMTSPKLFGVIIRILKRSDLAEEALQETLVLIWQRAGSFDPQIASPIAWMATIARNKAIDKKRLAAERLGANSVELDDALPALQNDPLDDTLRFENLRGLKACLDELPEERQQMVLLAYLEGWTREEIGQKFERPVATVKTILRRALDVLRGCLDGR